LIASLRYFSHRPGAGIITGGLLADFGGAFAGNAAGAAINVGTGIGGTTTPESVSSQANN
jgi:hypothetical protein